MHHLSVHVIASVLLLLQGSLDLLLLVNMLDVDFDLLLSHIVCTTDKSNVHLSLSLSLSSFALFRRSTLRIHHKSISSKLNSKTFVRSLITPCWGHN